MTHGTMLIRTEGEGVHEIELHTTHDGHTNEAVVMVARLPLLMLEHMLATKNPKIKILLDHDRMKKKNAAERYEDLLDLCHDILTFDIAPTTLASYIITAHFDTWFPMPTTSNQKLLDYWNHGRPDLVVTVGEDRLPDVSVELSSQTLADCKEDPAYLEEVAEDLEATVKELNESVAPHTSYCRDGVKVTYNFVEVMCALLANRYDELMVQVEEWKKYWREQRELANAQEKGC